MTLIRRFPSRLVPALACVIALPLLGASAVAANSELELHAFVEPAVLDTNDVNDPKLVGLGPSVRIERPVLAGTSAISTIIRQVSDDWLGTPYRWGGNTRRGIDCSAFVQTIMKDALEIDITRTTASQVHEGESVRREDLLPGDLVFFRRRGTRHVGIYLGNSEFIHSSSRRGVIISDMSSGYYDRHFWTARRVIDDPQSFLNSLSEQGISSSGERNTRNRSQNGEARR
ncbi:MAG: NlpC/P60 family protein [Rubricoccaceae bacterium]|nr:NlpC/P60 family protein [Rubricoccaceae bacterium]